MDKLIQLDNGEYAFIAHYKPQEVADYQGNPLIEALPPILSIEDAFEQLSFLPEYNEKETNLSAHHRYHSLLRLTRFYQPLEKTLELEARFSRLIRGGYIYRNPKDKSHAETLIELHKRLENNEPLGLSPNISKTASSLSIIGFSGMGKTSSVERVLSLYPKAIVHQYPLNIVQIPWLKLNCPNDGSPKTLCLDFFTKIDDVLGTTYFKQFGKKGDSLSFLIIRVGQLARAHCLGVLIIDEIQHLLTAKDEVSNSMMNFLVTLVNEIGIPIMLIGTTKAKELLQINFRQARRAGGHGELIWEQMKNDDNWEVLITSMWQYQWTKEKVKLTDTWRNVIYEESQGIVDIAVKLFLLAQSYAIESGQEKISPNMIIKVKKKYLRMVQDMLEALKRGIPEEIAKYDDITPFDIEDFIQNKKPVINMRDRILQQKEKLAGTRQQKELSILEKVILTLINLDVNEKLAESTAKRVINENKNIGKQEAVQKALTIINQINDSKKAKEINSNSKRKMNIIFKIVDNGRKERKAAHDSLLEKGLIIAPFSDNKLF
ncbi:AAA domain-containing protein [Bacillus oleivorans]|uniref:AAA domain-containing protein n=1 Tax=Bacillus oleivorans TaxID=1448271 RepID=A0A285D4T7_9BACI|nr:ATP-binding protein [Bacillus oleivorans]SNX74328.1 AAA domain-containing protein [Bacillus oleivorans]